MDSKDQFCSTETNIFLPYRTVGVICTSVPPVYIPGKAGRHGLICCALDRQICAYKVNPLRLSFSTEALESTINLLAADSKRFYASYGVFIAIMRNRNLERRLVIPNGGPKLLHSMTDTLVVIDKADNINVFDVENGDLLVHLVSSGSFSITAIIHPDTYVNKILVGSSDGRMHLWNLKSGQLIYQFSKNSQSSAAITVLEQSTVIDVVAIGFADGQIDVRNIKFDKLICSFYQSKQITALAFRTDDVNIFASANIEGTIAIWNLNEQILIGQMKAHNGIITRLYFLIGQPYLLSSGEDNKISKWFFRNENGLPEMDSELSGHMGSVKCFKFITKNKIVTACEDKNVRMYNLKSLNRKKDFGSAREVRSADISKDRFIDVRLNTIVEIQVNQSRASVWDNMICRHEDSPMISTWSTRLFKRGHHLLYHKRFVTVPELQKVFASSLYLSACGTFSYVGYSSGHVDVFNMQNGKYKLSLQSDLNANKRRIKNRDGEFKAHQGLVSGIAADIMNHNVVTGGSDGTIHFWKFGDPALLCTKMKVSAGVQLFRMNLENSMLIVAIENGQLGVLDVLCRRLIRLFSHFACTDFHAESSRITALEFSTDGKWLLSADNLGFLKVWDLPSGMLIDVIRFLNPCIDIGFGHQDALLVTCHEGKKGIYLWANKLLYLPSSFLPKSVEQLHKDASTALASLPIISNDNGEIEEENLNNFDVVGSEEETYLSIPMSERVVRIDEDEDEDESQYEEQDSTTLNIDEGLQTKSHQQLDSSLCTLSGLPPSRWAGLPILEQIRQRNRPIEPPKRPNKNSIPFLLTTVDTLGTAIHFDKDMLNEAKRNYNEQQKSIAKRHNITSELLRSPWINTLLSADSINVFRDVFSKTKEMSLSSIDFQIRSMNDASTLCKFMEMLIEIMKSRQEFELVQCYLATFLNIHHESLWIDKKNKDVEGEENIGTGMQEQLHLTKAMNELLELQKKIVDDIQSLFDQNLSMIEFFKNML